MKVEKVASTKVHRILCTKPRVIVNIHSFTSFLGKQLKVKAGEHNLLTCNQLMQNSWAYHPFPTAFGILSSHVWISSLPSWTTLKHPSPKLKSDFGCETFWKFWEFLGRILFTGEKLGHQVCMYSRLVHLCVRLAKLGQFYLWFSMVDPTGRQTHTSTN